MKNKKEDVIKEKKKIGIQVTLDIAITIFVIAFLLAYVLNVHPVIENQRILQEYINENCIDRNTGYIPEEIGMYDFNERVMDERIPFYKPQYINYNETLKDE